MRARLRRLDDLRRRAEAGIFRLSPSDIRPHCATYRDGTGNNRLPGVRKPGPLAISTQTGPFWFHILLLFTFPSGSNTFLA